MLKLNENDDEEGWKLYFSSSACETLPGNTKGLYKRFEIVYFRYEVRFQKTLMQRNCVDTFSQTANVLE